MGTERLGMLLEDRAKRHAEDKLPCGVLDLDGAIVRVSPLGDKRAIEIPGRAHGLVVSRHRIGEVETQVIVAQGLAAAWPSRGWLVDGWTHLRPKLRRTP